MNFDKYQRQIAHKKIGVNGQLKLKEASVLVVGAGGLGCPVLTYLTAAGVGKIGIVDGDDVELSNLPRQVLYSEQDIDKNKAKCALRYLKELNGDVKFQCFPMHLDNEFALEIVIDYDIVIDCTDDFATRYILNDACCIMGRPLVYAAISGDEGQVAVFNILAKELTATYRDLFPVPPQNDEVPTCEQSGVVGVLPGIIGLIQANEVIKIITEQKDVLMNQVLIFNLSNYQSHILEIPRNMDVKRPNTFEEFKSFNYAKFCNREDDAVEEIDFFNLEEMKKESNVVFVDVREESELTSGKLEGFLVVPMSRFESEMKFIRATTKAVFICKSGSRSRKAAKIYKEKYSNVVVYSIRNGLEEKQKQMYH